MVMKTYKGSNRMNIDEIPQDNSNMLNENEIIDILKKISEKRNMKSSDVQALKEYFKSAIYKKSC